MDDVRPIRSETASPDGLTPIHGRIHCAATSDTPEEYSEGDLIIVESFLNTLAETALAVAIRNAKRHDENA